MLCYHHGVSISHLRSISGGILCNVSSLNSALLESGHSFFKCCNGVNRIFDGLPSTSTGFGTEDAPRLAEDMLVEEAVVFDTG